MRISIIGSGIVGKATGIGFHMHGNEVIFFDIDKEKLTQLEKEDYTVSENISDAVLNSTVSFICVQTPTVNGEMDFSYVERAITDVAKALKEKDDYHVIAIRSTVLPSTTRLRVIPLLERYSGLRVGENFGVCMNPEFLRQASALSDFLKPYRIVIGESDRRSGDLLEKLYLPFKSPIIRTTLDAAEMIKYISNAFLTTKISFFNEVFLLCKRFKLDHLTVAEAVALDPRIGKYGIYGGRPFEGKCLPKDLEAFINFLKTRQINPKILDAVLHINNEFMKMQVAEDDSYE
jgi:UDPglucose 6-dehydrogenase